MDINDKYREALDKITTKMLSYDKYEYLAKLEKQEKGKFSRIVGELDLDVAFGDGEYYNSAEFNLPENIESKLSYKREEGSYRTSSKLITEESSNKGELYCPEMRLLAA